MTVDHFRSGGRRSDSRLGRRGKKLGDRGIVAKSRFLKFLDFSWISLFEKMRKFTISKAPPLIFPFFRKIPEFVEKSKGGPLKSQIFAFFPIRKSMKNHEISEIAISRLSHFPTFLLSASFFPRRPSRESGRRPLDSENSWRNQREGGRRDSTTENGRL